MVSPLPVWLCREPDRFVGHLEPIRTPIETERRLLLCCVPAVYIFAADAAVAAAVFGLEHLISYCNKKIVLVLVWGTSERLVPAKKNRTPGTSERFVANCGVGPPPVGRATPLLW